jgi:ADP-heptose:LPS heptosyltransferase
MLKLNMLNSAYTGLILTASKAPVRIGRREAGKIVWNDTWQGEKAKLLSLPAGRNILTHIFEPENPSTRNKHESLFVRQAIGFDYHSRPFPPHPKGIRKSGRSDTDFYPKLARPDGLVDIWAEETIKRFSENGKHLIIGVNMESSYSLKAWAEERFIAVMRSLINESVRFLILGRLSIDISQKMKEYSKDIVLNLSGQTGLEELLAIISRCDLFFSIDSGPAHLAQAYQVPTLVLFGPSNDKEFGPVNPIHSVIIAKRDCGGPPCVLGPCPFPKSCMENIREEQVITKLVSMIRRKRDGNYPFREFPKNSKKEIIIFQ